MSKYYVYECTISELDIENNKTNMVFHASSTENNIHTCKEKAFKELRNILNTRCNDNAPSVSL